RCNRQRRGTSASRLSRESHRLRMDERNLSRAAACPPATATEESNDGGGSCEQAKLKQRFCVRPIQDSTRSIAPGTAHSSPHSFLWRYRQLLRVIVGRLG